MRLEQARDLARGLGPVGLNETGLDGALETLALSVRQLRRQAGDFRGEAVAVIEAVGHQVFHLRPQTGQAGHGDGLGDFLVGGAGGAGRVRVGPDAVAAGNLRGDGKRDQGLGLRVERRGEQERFIDGNAEETPHFEQRDVAVGGRLQ